MKLLKWTTFLFSASLIAASAHAQEFVGTLKKIKDSGSISLGVNEASIPLSYLDNKQSYQGYTVDLCMIIAAKIKDRLGMKTLDINMKPITSSTRIPLIVNGTVDITCGSSANTLERQKQVSFSSTIFIGNSSFVSKKASKINSLGDLKGKTIVSTSGASDIKQAADLSKELNLGLNILVASDHSNSFLMMETDRAAAFFMTDILVAGLVASSKSPDSYSIQIIEQLPVEAWGLIVRRDDPQFKKLVDDTLAETFKSGEINRLYTKWFQSTLPTLGINLNIPMSKKLKAAIANPTDSGDPKTYN